MDANLKNEQDTMRMVLENFDAEAFLNYEYEQATETHRTLIPLGWVRLQIEAFELIKPKLYVHKKTGLQEYTSPALKLKARIDDEGVRATLGFTDPARILYAYPTLYLDITSNMVLDMGPNKNLALGQLRQALGQNEDGVSWRFADLIMSREIYAEVKHRADKDDPEKVYENWSTFAAEPKAADAKAA